MYNHAPKDYVCPLCFVAVGKVAPGVVTLPQDVIYRTDLITAFVSPKWWPNNKAHVVIIPHKHFENIYEITSVYIHAVFDAAQKVGIALKAVYACDGISLRQHNEPAGGQEAWHYHLHVVPRYSGDNFFKTDPLKGWISAGQRLPYAEKLRIYLAEQNS